jgi:nucleoside-diphosphate-sugar epimerase
MRVGITGASGFLGTALRAVADSRGHASFSLPLPRDGSLRECAWRDTWPSPESLDLLIHGAASVRPATELDLYLNSQLPRALQAYFHEKNPAGRFTHISTINVLIDALIDPYSASKRLAETTIDLERAVIVRPSLIWSSPEGGPARRLRAFLVKFPIAFMAFPGSRHLPVHVDDLARTIISLGESGRDSGVINAYGDKAYTLWQLAKGIAKQEDRFLCPIPCPFTSQYLPKMLRLVDYTRFSATWKPIADHTIVLPFRVPEEQERASSERH